MADSVSDVLVIGGGVIGLSIAYRLRQRGLRVMLLERRRCGREASWAGAGMLIPPNPHRRGPMQLLLRRSLELYPRFCEELAAATGVDPEYEVCGALEILTTEQRYRMALSDQRAVAGRGAAPDSKPLSDLQIEVLEPARAAAVEPALGATAPYGVLYVRSAAQVRNSRLLPALLIACQRAGVDIREGVTVSGLVRHGERVVGTRTGSTEFHSAAVVLAAGAWSAQVAPEVAELMPVYPVRGQIVLLWMLQRPFRPIIEERPFYLVPRRDGHVLLGTTEEHDSGFEKRNTPQAVSRLISAALRMVPMLSEASVSAMWSGLRPGTPDRRPYIGPVPGVEGLIAATGHFRSGLMLAPITAEVVADLLTTGKLAYDLSPCRPGRGEPPG
ncbi:MAG TPA: glycine oxidase ThiO [Phycisphaerae bacterium]|jgi:glycine oxidase